MLGYRPPGTTHAVGYHGNLGPIKRKAGEIMSKRVKTDPGNVVHAKGERDGRTDGETDRQTEKERDGGREPERETETERHSRDGGRELEPLQREESMHSSVHAFVAPCDHMVRQSSNPGGGV